MTHLFSSRPNPVGLHRVTIVEVDDAAVDKTIEILRKQRTKFAQVERAARDGDRVPAFVLLLFARAVVAPYIAFSGTCISPMESRSVRGEVIAAPG